MPRLPSARLSAALLATAAEQHGLLTTVQLRDAGIDRNALRSLRRGSRLFPALIGVWSLVPAIDLDAATMVWAAPVGRWWRRRLPAHRRALAELAVP